MGIFDIFKKKNGLNTSSTNPKDIPVEELISAVNINPTFSVVQQEREIPPFQGDYAKAVFLWGIGKKSIPYGENNFAGYITYECGIKDPVKYMKQMIDEGYLEEASLADSLETFSGNRLKEIAEEVGVAKSGTKGKLVERIMTEADADYLYKIAPRCYGLTEKAKQFVAEHDDCVQIHKHKNCMVSWSEYKAVADKNQGSAFPEIMSQIIIQRAAADSRIFGRNDYLYLSELWYEYGKPELATKYLLQCMYIDISGSLDINSFEMYRQGIGSKQSLLDSFNFACMFNVSLLERIIKNKEYYSSDIIHKLYTWKLPVQICEESLFTEMMEHAISGDYNRDYYETELYKRYARFVDSLK